MIFIDGHASPGLVDQLKLCAAWLSVSPYRLAIRLEDCLMTADGNWNLVVSTPMGERHGSLSLKTEGTTVKGSQMADGNSTEIFDGTVDGNEISWKVSITDPMPMTLEFTGMVDGHEIAGTVKLGEFGNSSFSGSAVRGCATSTALSNRTPRKRTNGRHRAGSSMCHWRNSRR
jgi:hypothetical protein